MPDEQPATDATNEDGIAGVRPYRIWTIAAVTGGLAAVLLPLVFYFSYTLRYRASAYIQIRSVPTTLLGESDSDSEEQKTFVRTQLALIRSPLVLYGSDDIGPKGVVDELLNGELEDWSGSHVPGLPPKDQPDRQEIGEFLLQHLSVLSVAEPSDLYTISFSSPSPRFARAVVNSVTRNYLDLLADHGRRRNSQVITLLEEAYENRMEELQLDRKQLLRLADQFGRSGAVAVDLNGGLPMRAQLGELREQLTSREVAVELAEARVRLLEASIGAKKIVVTDEQIEEAIDNHPLVKGAKKFVLKKQLKLMKEKVRAGQEDDGAVISRLEDEIKKTKSALTGLRQELRTEIEEQLEKSRLREMSKELVAVRDQLQFDQMMAEVLRQRYEEALEEAQSSRSQDIEFQLKAAEMERKQELANRISERIEALKTEASAPVRMQLWRWADEPTRPLQLYPVTRMLAAVAIGLLVPFVLAAAWQLLKQPRRCGEE